MVGYSRPPRPTSWSLRLAQLLAAYLVGGLLLHHLILPGPRPGPEDYPQKGDILQNSVAGQSILFTETRDLTDGKAVVLDVYLEPGGSAPYAHAHWEIEETVVVVQGRIIIEINGVDQLLRAGEELVIEQGSVHQPRNDGRNMAHLRVRLKPPGDLDLALVQLHGYLTDEQAPKGGLHDILRGIAMANAYNLYSGGLPMLLQRFAAFFLAPTARLLGHHPFEPAYVAGSREQR